VFCDLLNGIHRDLKASLGIVKQGALKYAILVKPENIVEFVERLQTVKSIEVEQVTYTFNESTFKPVANVADRVVQRAVFRKPSKRTNVKDAVLAFVKKGNLRSATITGIDPVGRKETFKLLNDYDSFGEYDYDDFIGSVSLDAADFDKTIRESSNIKSLIDIAKTEPVKQLLEAPAK
jgi:hypothetical protein